MTRYVWGLDIGGTKSALCVGSETGEILFRQEIATARFPHWQALLHTLCHAVPPVYAHPLAVGVSCGGPLDAQQGTILSPPNLPGWVDVPVTAYLRDRIGCPAYLQNDADACALAEWRYGAGRGAETMIFLTFGTGLGAGLILQGSLYRGACGMAGELGHIRMAPRGPVGYGKEGSWEGFCSGGGLQNLAKLRLGQALSAKELVSRADAGDPGAQIVLRESAEILGRGLALLMDLLNPQRIILGSIYARATRWFADTALAVARQEALPYTFAACQVLPAQLGDRIGDVAAITVAWNGYKEEQPHAFH